MGTASVDNGGVAHVSGGINSNRTGRHLRDSYDIRELAHRHPMVVRNNLTLDHRDHCVAASKTEEADEEEGVEELEVYQGGEV